MSTSTSDVHPPSLPPLLTPLEQEVLDEYSKLLDNMNRLSDSLASLNSMSVMPETLDGLRLLERKTATVCTLLKASVYSIVLSQEVFGEEQQQQEQEEQELQQREREQQQRRGRE